MCRDSDSFSGVHFVKSILKEKIYKLLMAEEVVPSDRLSTSNEPNAIVVAFTRIHH